MTVVGLYVPRNSVLHRLPAGVKLLVLVAAAAASGFVRGPVPAILALAVVALLFLLARIPWWTTVEQVRPLLWFAVPLLGFHLAVSGWERGVQVVGTLVALILLAAVVSLTTRVTDLCDVVVRLVGPLRRLGVDPDRLGLLVALGVRAVPVLVGLAQEVRDAQRARGLRASPTAFVVPLVVRSLHHADRLGEALVARGVDD